MKGDLANSQEAGVTEEHERFEKAFKDFAMNGEQDPFEKTRTGMMPKEVLAQIERDADHGLEFI